MSPKRASPPENSSRQSKKQKITAARSIAVQGLESGPSRSSKSNDTNGQWHTQTLGVELTRYIHNLVVLPDSIDVEKFVEVSQVYRSLSMSKMHSAVPFF
jgi:hypothetical protein